MENRRLGSPVLGGGVASLGGVLACACAASAIVPFASLMPIRGVVMPVNPLLQEYIRSRLFEPYTGSIVTGLPGVSWWWPRQNTAQ